MGRLIAIYIALVLILGGGFIWLLAALLYPGEASRPTEAMASETVLSQVSEQAPLDLGGLEPSPLPLSMPLSCDPGVDCWPLKYVDLDPSKGRRDYQCGAMTVDGHKGVDFAISDPRRLNRNEVPVLAAATGKVVGIRDEMPDVNIRIAGKASLKGRDCGNGVRIDHGGGWVSQYCHLKRGSVEVKAGDTVVSGDRLGLVGLSGSTEFLHLHVQFEKNGKVVDPFVGLGADESACGLGKAPLWKESVLRSFRYSAPLIQASGIAAEAPDTLGVSEGKYTDPKISPDAPLLVLWTDLYGLRKGDRISMRFTGADGAVLAETDWVQAKSQLRTFKYIGKKARQDWPKGNYRGVVQVERPSGPGKNHAVQKVDLRID